MGNIRKCHHPKWRSHIFGLLIPPTTDSRYPSVNHHFINSWSPSRTVAPRLLTTSLLCGVALLAPDHVRSLQAFQARAAGRVLLGKSTQSMGKSWNMSTMASGLTLEGTLIWYMNIIEYIYIYIHVIFQWSLCMILIWSYMFTVPFLTWSSHGWTSPLRKRWIGYGAFWAWWPWPNPTMTAGFQETVMENQRFSMCFFGEYRWIIHTWVVFHSRNWKFRWVLSWQSNAYFYLDRTTLNRWCLKSQTRHSGYTNSLLKYP